MLSLEATSQRVLKSVSDLFRRATIQSSDLCAARPPPPRPPRLPTC